MLETLLEDSCKEIVSDPLAAANQALFTSPLTSNYAFISGFVPFASSILCNNA